MIMGNGKSNKHSYLIAKFKKACLVSIALPMLLPNIGLFSSKAFAQRAVTAPNSFYQIANNQIVPVTPDVVPPPSSDMLSMGGDTPQAPEAATNDEAARFNTPVAPTTEAEPEQATAPAEAALEEVAATAEPIKEDEEKIRINNAINQLNTMRANGPVQWVRSLLVLQDDVATGQPGAMQLQPVLLNEIGQKLLAAENSTWDNTENVYALITYLFNGGNPKVVESVLRTVPEKAISKGLRSGAIAYGRNRQTAFLNAFKEMPKAEDDFPIALQVSIALGTANGIVDHNAPEAMKRLDYVRLNAPGSLFEEAALRREVKVAIAAGHVDKLALLARNYVERFSKSPYANEFWREFSVEVPKVEYRLDDDQLQSLISVAPNIVQFIIHMQVSRGALLDARMQRAHFSSEKALQLAKTLKINDSAAKLYYAASFVGSTSAQKAADVLQTISIDKLPKRDKPLLAAAKYIADDVMYNNQSWPFPIADERTGDDPMAVLAQLPVEAPPENKPAPDIPPNLSVAEMVSTNVQAEKFANDIDDFMKETKEKIENVDKMLEKKK